MPRADPKPAAEGAALGLIFGVPDDFHVGLTLGAWRRLDRRADKGRFGAKGFPQLFAVEHPFVVVFQVGASPIITEQRFRQDSKPGHCPGFLLPKVFVFRTHVHVFLKLDRHWTACKIRGSA